MFLGAPGAGKGTYAKVLSSVFDLPIIGTGSMMREMIASGTEQGRLLSSYVDQGAMVPDEVVLALLQTRLAQPDATAGFILDGFPRTVAQAVALESFAKLHLVVNIVLPDRWLSL